MVGQAPPCGTGIVQVLLDENMIESKLKRICSVKDSSNLIPGHGGLLDRIDGSIFALPIGFIIISLL